MRETRKAPYVFTEQGVAMLSSVLNSKRAIQVNIQIMRTFTKLREIVLTNKGLKHAIEKLERFILMKKVHSQPAFFSTSNNSFYQKYILNGNIQIVNNHPWRDIYPLADQNFQKIF